MKYNMYQELVDRINFYIKIVDKIPSTIVYLLTKEKYIKDFETREFWRKELEKRKEK